METRRRRGMAVVCWIHVRDGEGAKCELSLSPSLFPFPLIHLFVGFRLLWTTKPKNHAFPNSRFRKKGFVTRSFKKGGGGEGETVVLYSFFRVVGGVIDDVCKQGRRAQCIKIGSVGLKEEWAARYDKGTTQKTDRKTRLSPLCSGESEGGGGSSFLLAFLPGRWQNGLLTSISPTIPSFLFLSSLLLFISIWHTFVFCPFSFFFELSCSLHVKGDGEETFEWWLMTHVSSAWPISPRWFGYENWQIGKKHIFWRQHFWP